eukprot:TRINITY_DN7193_c0_g3_i1.p1 TRINITY_DN7193_c0_g3~~TRINITY_DN7193_c0_g3_i1.p1  ORF type:complete len:211 (-),score=30.17 TRINITY_DN7193_c0_g3_i1:85-717(-)
MEKWVITNSNTDDRYDAKFSNGKYDSPWQPWKSKTFWELLKWRGAKAKKPHTKVLDAEIPVIAPDFEKIRSPPADKIQITWIGHSSFLVQMEGVNFLTDPIWSNRCSPTQMFGPARFRPVPMKISELPPIDFVLISHNHYDHLDEWTVLQLKHKTVFVVPVGLGAWFKASGFKSSEIIELNWWDKVEFSKSLSIIGTPAQHWLLLFSTSV